MGASGVTVDGHHILPSAGSGEPTIVPLQDHSLFTIHNKIFRFDYPTTSTRPILAVFFFFFFSFSSYFIANMRADRAPPFSFLFHFRHRKLNVVVPYECQWLTLH
jgi:hypothetical protein